MWDLMDTFSKTNYIIRYEEYLKVLENLEYKEIVLEDIKNTKNKNNSKIETVLIEIKDINMWRKNIFKPSDFEFLQKSKNVYVVLNDIIECEYVKLDRFLKVYKEYNNIVKLINGNKELVDDIHKVYYLMKYLSMSMQYNTIPYIKRKNGLNLSKEEKFLIEKEETLEAILTHKSNCHGYASAFYYICTLLKIDAMMISGYLNGSLGGHSANLVKIDSKWYYIDITNEKNSLYYRTHLTKSFLRKVFFRKIT